MEEILRKKGYKVTPARLAILDVLVKSREPLNAQAIHRKLSRTRRTRPVNEATVYRTMLVLCGAGILRRVNLGDSTAHFELASRPHHHHVVCTKCALVEDLASRRLEKMLAQVASRANQFRRVTEHSLEFFGLCRTCAG